MPRKISSSTEIRLVAPSDSCVAMTWLASERKETTVYHSVWRRTPAPTAQATTTATGTAAPAAAAPAQRSASRRLTCRATSDPASRTVPKTRPPTMLCFIPTASIASRPARNASPADTRRTARSASQHEAITSGMPKSSPLAPTGSISALQTSAAVATATHPARRRTAAASSTPARTATSRAAAAAASTSNEQASAPSSRWAYGPPIRSVACTSQMIGGGRSTQ